MPLYYVRTADNVLIYLVLAIGLNMVVGYAGLLDLGFVAFYAIGAYSYAILASGQFDIHLPFALVLFIGGGARGLAGVLLGIPVLRLRGDYLAIVTLGFGEIIRLLLNNLDRLTNGPQGISRIDRPDLFGLALQTPAGLLLFPAGAAPLSPSRWSGGWSARYSGSPGGRARGPGRRARGRHQHRRRSSSPPSASAP